MNIAESDVNGAYVKGLRVSVINSMDDLEKVMQDAEAVQEFRARGG